MELALAVYEEITGSSELPPPVDEADFERRSHRRMPFGFRATILPTRKGVEGPASVVMVRDISVGGVSILHEEALKQGTQFAIEFKGTDDRPVRIQCTAVRCEQGGTGGTQYVIGATFDELLTKDLPPAAKEEQVAPLSDQSHIPAKPIKSQTQEQPAPVPVATEAQPVAEESPNAQSVEPPAASTADSPVASTAEPPAASTAELPVASTTELPAQSATEPPAASTAEPLEEPAEILEWLNEAESSAEKPREEMEKQTPPVSSESKEEAVVQAQTQQEPAAAPEDQAKILGRLTKPEPETAANSPHPAEPAKPAGDPPKTSGRLFRPKSEAEKKSKRASAESEEEVAAPPPPAKPAAPAAPAVPAGPIWTDVPESPAPVPITLSPTVMTEPVQPAEAVKPMSIVRDALVLAGPAAAKNHEILTKVQSLLSTQKLTLENQDREIQTLIAEAEELKRKISQLQTKSDADDKSIAELAAFLSKEVGDAGPKEKQNENIAA